MSLPSFDFYSPDSFAELFEIKARYGEDARYVSGGTALVLLMRAQLLQPAALLALGHLPGMREVEHVDGWIRIGALKTHAELARSPALREYVPALARTFGQVATPRIRNVGTVGGNLAHADPHQDPPVTLMALGARVVARGPEGERRISLDELFVGYYETLLGLQEVLTAVEIPMPRPQNRSAFVKFLARSADDYATANVAVSLHWLDGQITEARIVIGSMGPTPLRARQAEALLIGRAPEPELLRRVGEAAAAVTDPELDSRGSPEYKRRVTPVIVARAIREAWGAPC